jgi:threonine/homoserine/homoserine lactone efflux protein
MVDWIEMLEASIWGLLAGFITSALGGPINVTVINEAAKHGFRRSLLITLGAVLMESVYCGIAFAGFSGFLEHRVVQAAMELISFFLVLWLGIQYLRVGPVHVDNSVEEFVERKLHPTSGFWTGFIRVLGNPGVLLLWIGITGSLIAHHALEPVWVCKGLFCAGVAVASFGWFSVLAWGISHGQGSGRFSPHSLRRLSQFSGVALLVTAAIIGVRLVLLLSKR